MTWTAYHRRGDVLREVLATADRRRDGILPMDVDGVAQTFTDDLDLVAALSLRWHTRLAGRIEHALMDQPWDLEEAVVSAWRQTAREMPGTRAILDRYTDEPTTPEMGRALATSAVKEQQLLAVMAGRANERDAAGARVGSGLVLRARAGIDVAPRERVRSPHRLLTALRSVVAA